MATFELQSPGYDNSVCKHKYCSCNYQSVGFYTFQTEEVFDHLKIPYNRAVLQKLSSIGTSHLIRKVKSV